MHDQILQEPGMWDTPIGVCIIDFYYRYISKIYIELTNTSMYIFPDGHPQMHEGSATIRISRFTAVNVYTIGTEEGGPVERLKLEN